MPISFTISQFSDFYLGRFITIVKQGALITQVSLYNYFFDNEEQEQDLPLPDKWKFLYRPTYEDPVWTYDVGLQLLSLSLPYFEYGRTSRSIMTF